MELSSIHNRVDNSSLVYVHGKRLMMTEETLVCGSITTLLGVRKARIKSSHAKTLISKPK